MFKSYKLQMRLVLVGSLCVFGCSIDSVEQESVANGAFKQAQGDNCPGLETNLRGTPICYTDNGTENGVVSVTVVGYLQTHSGKPRTLETMGVDGSCGNPNIDAASCAQQVFQNNRPQ